jgi:polyhydroxybutyrate depolymerase
VAGQVTNLGLEEINSFDLSWTIGAGTFTTTISGLSIPSLGAYSFSHPDLLTINQSGLYNLQVNISNVNGIPADLNATNDQIIQTFVALEFGTIADGGLTREYIYYHPGSAPPDCPLVFVCHGYSGSAQGIMNYSEFNALAEEFGFAVCYPQGIEDSYGNNFFNVGYDFQNNETVDDVAYLQNLTAHFQANYSLSNEDIFCTGMSNGGDFCYLLACEASETFKAVAPISGMIRQEIMNACNPANEVSIFEIHGTQDNVTYFDGDPNNIDNWGAYPSIPETIEFWADLFDLSLLSSQNLPNTNTSDGSTVASEKYGAAGHCTEVWLYTVNGGGHDWPGAFGNMDISASREAWLFFEQLCDNTVGLENIQPTTNRKLIRILDLSGREITARGNTVLIYQYDDGSVEKKVIFE